MIEINIILKRISNIQDRLRVIPFRLSLFLYFIFCIGLDSVSAQELTGFAVEYGDTFKEWKVIPADVEINLGELNLSWPHKLEWNDWEYQLDGRFGNIRQKWINRPNEWELIDGEFIVSIKNQWRGDLTIWKIKCDDYTLRFESKYSNLSEEWTLVTDKHGAFDIFTEYEGDPRDWIIEDNLDEDVPLALKMAMLFLAIHYSVPHR